MDALLASEGDDPARGNAALLLLEKGMARLAAGDPDAAVAALRRARDGLDAHAASTLSDWLGAGLLDDEARAFAGADYEVVLVRAALALADLLAGGGDAYAYALQVGEKQEEILGSDFGDRSSGYWPRRQYERIALGAYLQGILREENLAPTDAALAFERGLSWAPGNPALEASRERARSGRYAPEGCGVLHVLYLGGRGPHLVPGRAPPTDAAVAIAAIGLAVAGKGVANLGQAPVPVPRVAPGDLSVPPLAVRVDGSAETVGTVPLLDVNRVAGQQLEANMPGIVARALVRRVVKGTVGAVIEGEGDDAGRSVLGFLVTAVSTGLERAETRCWTSLPGEFQVARLALAEGDHLVSPGPGMEIPVRITRGRASFLVVLRPNLAAPGAVVVDVHSRAGPRAGAPEGLPPIPPPER